MLILSWNCERREPVPRTSKKTRFGRAIAAADTQTGWSGAGVLVWGFHRRALGPSLASVAGPASG